MQQVFGGGGERRRDARCFSDVTGKWAIWGERGDTQVVCGIAREGGWDLGGTLGPRSRINGDTVVEETVVRDLVQYQQHTHKTFC